MSSGLFLGIFLSIPAFLAISTATLPGAIFGGFCFVLIVSLFGSNLPAFMTGLFPPQQRYSGVGIAYNFSQALFSGTAPFVQTALVLVRTNSRYSNTGTASARWLQPLLTNDSRIYPAYYMMAVATVSLTVLLTCKPVEVLGFEPLHTDDASDPFAKSVTNAEEGNNISRNINNDTEDSLLSP